MKKLLLLLFMPLVTNALPKCYPGDTLADGMLPTITADIDGCAAVWFCDSGEGHWLRQFIAGHGAECDYGYVKAIGQLFMPKADKDSLWAATFTVPGALPADSHAFDLALAVPKPTQAPPSGVFTRDTKVYKLSARINSPAVFTLVGAVSLGVTCDASNKIGPYYRIDRTKVVFPKGTVMPLATYANCDP